MRDVQGLFDFTNRAANDELDRIGDITGCWRLSRRESTRDFSWRLAIHIQEQILDREQLLEIVLSLARSPTCTEKEQA